MDELKKQDKIKDLSMIIIETNLIGIDLSEHIRVLIQHLDYLKSDIYSKRLVTVHLNLLLRELRTNIDKLLND